MAEKKARVAVLVSGGGTNLQAILDAQRAGVIRSGEVVLVISNKADAYALERARLAGVETLTVLRGECGGQEAFERAVAQALERGPGLLGGSRVDGAVRVARREVQRPQVVRVVSNWRFSISSKGSMVVFCLPL